MVDHLEVMVEEEIKRYLINNSGRGRGHRGHRGGNRLGKGGFNQGNNDTIAIQVQQAHVRAHLLALPNPILVAHRGKQGV